MAFQGRIIQNALNAGELSPLLAGRTDLDKYRNSCKTLLNTYCMKYGGASRRPGSRFVAEVKDSGDLARLIEFEFSTVQAYIIEMGDEYFRYYKDSGRIENPPGTPVETTTPYLSSELRNIQYAQSADVLYLVHGSHAPRKLSRTSHIAWTLTEIDFLDGPYLAERTDITITPDGTTGSVELTASAALFEAGHVGSLWRLKHGTDWSWFKVTAFTDSTHVDADVRSASTTASASDAFREGAWSAVRGYPVTVALFQQRLWFGGTSNNPDTLWGSQTSDYENFSPGTAEDNEACTFTLSSNTVDAIRWMRPARALLIGTTSHEWQASGGSVDEPITPGNINARIQSSHGSAEVQSIEVDNVTMYLQRAARKLHEIVFDFQIDGFISKDIGILSEHITEGGVIQLAYQPEPVSVVWSIRSDGFLLGMTYERDQDVIGWHRHQTDGDFESVAVIPHPDGDEDQVWVIVNRDGGRYVEYLDNKGGYYGPLNVDSGLVYSGAATDTLTGLGHLEGQTVDILGDGAVYPQQVVSGGQVSGLSPEVTQAEVGLHYESTIETQRPTEGPGSRKRFDEIGVRLHESIGITINGEQLPFRSAADPMDSPVPIFTGDKKVSHLGWDEDARITIMQQQPLPFTVLAMYGRLSVSD